MTQNITSVLIMYLECTFNLTYLNCIKNHAQVTLIETNLSTRNTHLYLGVYFSSKLIDCMFLPGYMKTCVIVDV
jgi:hypothetical protein